MPVTKARLCRVAIPHSRSTTLRNPPILPYMARDPTQPDFPPLTPEQRMLLQMRDTLYEGNWDDFLADLNARADNRPHVFATVPASADMRATIAHHLALIADMQRWEREHQRTLEP